MATWSGETLREPRARLRVARRDDSILWVIDAQESLLAAMPDSARLAGRIGMLCEAAGILGIPIVATEQYPERLGHTVQSVRDRWGETHPIAKLAFSGLGASGMEAALRAMDRSTAVLCGVESHVCVQQTAHDLLSQGWAVHVVSDAVASRTDADCRAGLDKVRDSGGVVSTAEMVIFEWLERAGTPEFKRILALVK